MKKCNDCVFCKVMKQEDGIDAEECTNPISKQYGSWVAGDEVCDAFSESIGLQNKVES
mgnify:CR=1 FL=1